MASTMPTCEPSFMALQAALAASIAKGTFVDTTYYLYSQRGPDGKARSPHPVFANSVIMRSFPGLIPHGLCSSLADEATPDEFGDYDYEADSDLDEDEIIDDMDDLSDVSSVQSVSSCATAQHVQVKDKPKAIGEFVDARQETVNESPFNYAGHESSIPTKFKYFIPNIAATTWQALIFFVYTGKVFFAPLKSDAPAHRLAKEDHARKFPDGPPLCSPKSMFRLAKLMGMGALQSRAQAAIEASLSESCIVDEVFSEFSSRHPEVLEMQLQYLYDAGRLARVMPRVRQCVKAAVRGSMPHCEAILDILLTKLSETLAPAIHTPTQPPQPRTRSGEGSLPSTTPEEAPTSQSNDPPSVAFPCNSVDPPNNASSTPVYAPLARASHSSEFIPAMTPNPASTVTEPHSGDALQTGDPAIGDTSTDHRRPPVTESHTHPLEVIDRPVAGGDTRADTEPPTERCIHGRNLLVSRCMRCRNSRKVARRAERARRAETEINQQLQE